MLQEMFHFSPFAYMGPFPKVLQHKNDNEKAGIVDPVMKKVM